MNVWYSFVNVMINISDYSNIDAIIIIVKTRYKLNISFKKVAIFMHVKPY